jgi:hypothetical protein
MLWIGLIWLRIGNGSGVIVLEVRSKEPSDSVKRGEFLDQLRICWLFRKDSAPCSQL